MNQNERNNNSLLCPKLKKMIWADQSGIKLNNEGNNLATDPATELSFCWVDNYRLLPGAA